MRDLENFGERGFDFLLARIFQTLGKRAENCFLFVEPGADDERETKLLVVGFVRRFKDRELLLRTPYLVVEGVLLAGIVLNVALWSAVVFWSSAWVVRRVRRARHRSRAAA